MSTTVNLRGVPKVAAAIRLMVTYAQNAGVLTQRVLGVLTHEINALQKARTAIDSATLKIEKSLEIVAASYTGDLPDDGDWTEVMPRIEDGDPIRELAELQEAIEAIVQEFSAMNIQGWIDDLEDLELPSTARYDAAD